MYPERVLMVKLCNEEVDWVTVQAPEAEMVEAIVAFLFILAPLATPMRPFPERGGHGHGDHAPDRWTLRRPTRSWRAAADGSPATSARFHPMSPAPHRGRHGLTAAADVPEAPMPPAVAPASPGVGLRP